MSGWPHANVSRFVQAAGIRWHVQSMGEGPPVLLIHGTGASTHSWRDVMPLLSRHYSVIAADLPGHGLTESAPAGMSSIRGMSGAVAALLDALQVTPQCCVGHSAGAVVLCQMAIDRLISPRVIVSINGAFFPLQGAAGVLFSPLARMFASWAFVPRLLSRRLDSSDVARLVSGTGSTLDATGIELYCRLVRDPKHVAGALAMMGNWNLYAFERDLPRLRVPLVLMVADNDGTVPPRQSAEVRQKVPTAVIHRLGALGHLAHEERPAFVARELLDIFASH